MTRVFKFYSDFHVLNTMTNVSYSTWSINTEHITYLHFLYKVSCTNDCLSVVYVTQERDVQLKHRARADRPLQVSHSHSSDDLHANQVSEVCLHLKQFKVFAMAVKCKFNMRLHLLEVKSMWCVLWFSWKPTTMYASQFVTNSCSLKV